MLCRDMLSFVPSGISLATRTGRTFPNGEGAEVQYALFILARKVMLHRLLVTATPGTATARINGMMIHSACNFSVDNSCTTSHIDSAGVRGACVDESPRG